MASELCGDISFNVLLRAGSAMKSPVYSDPVCSWKTSKNGGCSERCALTALTVRRFFLISRLNKPRSASPHRAGTPAPSSLGGSLLNLLQFINTFIVFEASKLSAVFCVVLQVSSLLTVFLYIVLYSVSCYSSLVAFSATGLLG